MVIFVIVSLVVFLFFAALSFIERIEKKRVIEKYDELYDRCKSLYAVSIKDLKGDYYVVIAEVNHTSEISVKAQIHGNVKEIMTDECPEASYSILMYTSVFTI